MPPRLVIEVVGSTEGLEKAFAKSTRSAKAFSGTVKQEVEKTITAQVQQRAALEKLAAEYRLVARNAKQGSEVQITAAKLAARAERDLATSYGIVNREVRRGTHGFTLLHGEVGKASRGALAGSGVFRSLGRSIAFASGGFLAFATAGDFLRKSIDAAKEAQVTQKQLGAQFRASGQDLSVYQAEIDKTANRLSLLAGFENDEIKAAFTTIFRTTSNVSLSLRDLGTAADLARAKHLALNQAALIIAKTEAGNTTLLRRQGFQIAKNATAEQALAQVRAAVAGQARAGTTAQERFGAVLHNTEEIIGAALLPSLNRYLTSGAKWLTQMNKSGKLQKDVTAATKAVSEAISGVRTVLTPVVKGFRLFGDAVGGTKHEVELLSVAMLVLKARMVGIRFGVISGGLAGVGARATAAASGVSLLRARLLSLSRLSPIVVPIILNEIIKKTTGFDAIGKALSLGDATARDQTVTIGGRKFIKGSIAELEARQRLALQRRFGIPAGPNLFAPLPQRVAPAVRAAAAPLSLPQVSGSAQTALAKAVAEQIRLRLPRNLGGSAAGAQRIVLPQHALGAAQVLADSFTTPLRLQLEQARIAALGGDIKPVLLKLKSAAFKALKTERLSIQARIDAWNTIAGVNDQLKNQSGRIIGKFKHVGAGKFLRDAGITLSPEDFRRFKTSFAQVGLGGRVPGVKSQAFATTAPTPIVNVTLDGRDIAKSVQTHLRKDSTRRASSRRGPYAGRH